MQIRSAKIVVGDRLLSWVFLLVWVGGICFGQQTPHPEFLLRPGHPRLMFLESDFARVRQFIASDPQAKRWHENLLGEARRISEESTIASHLSGGISFAQSARVLRKIALLSALYRIDGEKEFANGGRQELLGLCALREWNPTDGLVIARMSVACGIGYDWLYDFLSVQDRQLISSAIMNLGLRPGLDLSQTRPSGGMSSDYTTEVCNAGLSLGALSIAEDKPDISNLVLSQCRSAIAPGMRFFVAPDGGAKEGPEFWNEATRFAAYYLASLHTSLDTDFGLGASPGLAETGLYRIESIGPMGKCFNAGDSSEIPAPAPQMFYFAGLFKRPLYAQAERRLVGEGGGIFDLLWAAAAPVSGQKLEAPLNLLFRGDNTAFLRTAWDDPQAIYVGFKGGYNSAAHAHLDEGTFVFDAMGQRWACCLGASNDGRSDYPGDQAHWKRYRVSTAGQNTLVINHGNQAVAGTSPLVAFKSSPRESYAVADLTNAYSQADQVRRGIGIFGRGRVLVMDEISLDEPCDIAWQMHTRARIKLMGRKALLTQGGKTLYAQLLSPPDVQFESADAVGAATDGSNPGVRKLLVKMHTQGPVRVSVLFDITATEKQLYPQDLQQWVQDSPVR